MQCPQLNVDGDGMNEWDVDAAWYGREADRAAAGGGHKHVNKLMPLSSGSRIPIPILFLVLIGDSPWGGRENGTILI